MPAVETYAEEDAQKPAQSSQECDKRDIPECQPRNLRERKAELFRAQILGNHNCDIGGRDAGSKARIVDYTDTVDLHGEESRCERSSEHCCKYRRYAAHYYEPRVLLIELQKLSCLKAESSADLYGSSFPACRTAEKMRNESADKDQRRHQGGDVGSLMYSHEYYIRIRFDSAELMKRSYQKASDRQEPYNIHMTGPELRCPCYAVVESSCNQPSDKPHQASQNYPFNKIYSISLYTAEYFPDKHCFTLIFRISKLLYNNSARIQQKNPEMIRVFAES